MASKEDYIEYATKAAVRANIDPTEVVQTIQCESNWNTESVGDAGTSFGLSQIHLPAHKDVSQKQATDAKFAIDFMVSEFSKGHQAEWTCARQLGFAT